MAIDHVQRARTVWPHLVARAANGLPPCSYGQICAEIGLHWRSARYFLGVIQRYCRANRLPPLQFLVVNAVSRLPGKGCASSPTTQAVHQNLLNEIYAHCWPIAAPF